MESFDISRFGMIRDDFWKIRAELILRVFHRVD